MSPFAAIVCRFITYPAATAGPLADEGRMNPKFQITLTRRRKGLDSG